MKATSMISWIFFLWETVFLLGSITAAESSQGNPAAKFNFSPQMLQDQSETFDVLIRGRNGLFIFGCIRKPLGEGPFPGIVLIHGGLGGNLTATRNIALKSAPADALVRHGYAVLSTDYRAHDWITEYEDIISAYEFFKQQSYVQTNAIAIMGGSHGGKLTLDVVTHIQPQAAVPCAGLYDLARLYEHCANSEFHQTRMRRRQSSPAGVFMKEVSGQLGGTPAQVPDLYRKHSGISKVGNVETPLLVVHGKHDSSVPLAFAIDLVNALQEQGKPVETYFPEAGPHGFYWGFSSQGKFGAEYDPKENEEFLKRLLAFLERHLGSAKP
jgi:dipeptidyl aminopeptidase/acylaminoacyl peptidase